MVKIGLLAHRQAHSQLHSQLNLEQGFTFIELFITLIIALIFVTIAIPDLSGQLREGALQKIAGNLTSALNQARSEAIKRDHWVTVCKSADGSVCDTSASWQDGWLMFADSDSDGAKDVGELLIRVYPSINSGFSITASSGNFSNWIAFHPSGSSQGNGGSGDTFRICYGTDTRLSRDLVVSAAGSVKLNQTAASCS